MKTTRKIIDVVLCCRPQNSDDEGPHGHQFNILDDVPEGDGLGVLLQNNGITRNGQSDEDNLQREQILEDNDVDSDAESDVDWDAGNNEALLEDNEDAEMAIDEDVEANQEDVENLINMQHEEDDQANFNNGQPLYRGSILSVGESMLLILMILLRHNVNYNCLADIIAVINMHCLQNNFQKISLNKFKKFFSLDANSITKHYYCSKCLKLFADINDVCRTCEDWKREYFVQLPFIDQLKEMFKRDNFFLHLQSRFNRPRVPPGVISDMYDASLYAELMENNGFLNNPNNLSFTWYTDGVPIYKSSKVSAWPLYLTINELPHEMRYKKENVILAGIWYGKKKPNANAFIHKFRDYFRELFVNGVQVVIPNPYRAINVKGILLRGTCDLPAKAQFLNMTQYNGRFGCQDCYCEGESIATGPNSSVWVFPYQRNFELRTTEDSNNYARLGTPQNPHLGVKGPNVFSKIMPDFIRGMGIDKMHGVDGGVAKKILSLLFDVQFGMFPFSLYQFRDLTNRRLMSIKPPKFVHRMPRCVEDLVHWKASELKVWFFHYSLPVLKDIMRNDYFQHVTLLITAIALLDSDIVTPEMIRISDDLLNTFVEQFEILYGLRFCTMNIHQLLHLPLKVENLGPLWSFSCFEFENLNGCFLRLVHGTWHIDSQMVKSHLQIIKMSKLLERLPDGDVKNFCYKKKNQVTVKERIGVKCHSVGCYQRFDLEDDNIVTIALRNSNVRVNDAVLWRYFRLLKNRLLYVAEMYPKNLQTKSDVAVYISNGTMQLGLIHCFMKIVQRCECIQQECECVCTHYAVVEEIVSDKVFDAIGNNYVQNTHNFLRQCHLTGNMSVIPIENLKSVCFHMLIDGVMYVGIPINNKELE